MASSSSSSSASSKEREQIDKLRSLLYDLGRKIPEEGEMFSKMHTNLVGLVGSPDSDDDDDSDEEIRKISSSGGHETVIYDSLHPNDVDPDYRDPLKMDKALSMLATAAHTAMGYYNKTNNPAVKYTKREVIRGTKLRGSKSYTLGLTFNAEPLDESLEGEPLTFKAEVYFGVVRIEVQSVEVIPAIRNEDA